jgi:hypothetical protein
MAIQTSFAKKVTRSEDCNDRFLALLGNDGEFDLALLDVKNRVLRLVRPDEEVKWRASRAKAIRQGNIEENDVGWIAFLVALTDRRKSGREAHRSTAARRRGPI